jgi:hypothetical protein
MSMPVQRLAALSKLAGGGGGGGDIIDIRSLALIECWGSEWNRMSEGLNIFEFLAGLRRLKCTTVVGASMRKDWSL